MPNLTIDTNAGAIALKYADAPNLVATSVTKIFNRVGQRVFADLVRNKLRGGVIGVRTGNLSRAAFWRVEVMGTSEILVRVGVAVEKAKYARVQDKGGTITPKHGQYLTVPLEAAQTGKGVARFTARQLFERPEAFGYTSAFIHKGVVFGVKGNKRSKTNIGTVVPIFALKRTVTIKAHQFIAATLRDSVPIVQQELGMNLANDLNGGLTS